MYSGMVYIRSSTLIKCFEIKKKKEKNLMTNIMLLKTFEKSKLLFTFSKALNKHSITRKFLRGKKYQTDIAFSLNKME